MIRRRASRRLRAHLDRYRRADTRARVRAFLLRVLLRLLLLLPTTMATEAHHHDDDSDDDGGPANFRGGKT